jgi:hypothetical protein
MGRPRSKHPKLCENSRGYLFAKDRDGRQHWFGHTDAPSSRQKYADFIGRLQRGDMASEAAKPPNKRGAHSVSELCVRFLTQHATRYKTADGKPSAEVDCFKSVIYHLRTLFGETAVNDFGPLRLSAVRQAMVEAGWSRNWVNKQVGRLRLMFRVGVSWEIVSKTVCDALKDLPALIPGETEAHETEPRTAVPDADLAKVRAVLQERHQDVFDLLLMTGARPGEILGLTSRDVVQAGEVWRADLKSHKTVKKGFSRTLFFVHAAQMILRKYLKTTPDERIFPFQRKEFSSTIQRACKRANVTPFTPHALRHTVATRLADDLGTEAAQRLLGHATRAMAEHYSKVAERLAIKAVKTLG